jgi:hypothetical protein
LGFCQAPVPTLLPEPWMQTRRGVVSAQQLGPHADFQFHQPQRQVPQPHFDFTPANFSVADVWSSILFLLRYLSCINWNVRHQLINIEILEVEATLFLFMRSGGNATIRCNGLWISPLPCLFLQVISGQGFFQISCINLTLCFFCFDAQRIFLCLQVA